jgi:hypothetical protein
MRFVSIPVMLLAFTAAVYAQGPQERRGWGYGFAGAGMNSQGTSLHVGGGGEFLIAGGFGFGAEAAHFGSTSRFGDNSVGMLSANVCYHFGGRNFSWKLVPFASGGISFANARSGGGNFGFGIQYWMHRRAALRFEFREHIFSSHSPFLPAFHFGISFR